jgi:O-antigen/teichoic acid export membrane protein
MTQSAERLTDRTTRAVQWRLASSVVGSLSQFGIGVLLARLLTPADFGVVALASVVLGLARPVGDLGIGNAVVQRADLTNRHVRTAFTCSVLLGLAATAVVAAAAPLAAVVMRNPAVTSVLRVLSVGFVCGGTAVVAGALLRRQLDFRRQFFIDTASYVVGYGVIGVGFAVLGYGMWSLVWAGLSQCVVAAAAQLAVVRHSVRPLLAKRELRELLHFGVGATVNSCVNYVALNGDNFVVGRWIGAASLGLYSRAYALMNLPFVYVANVLSSVLFPAFAHVQAEPVRLRRGYLMMSQLTAMVAAPSLATLAIAAPHLIRSLYGPQWTGVVVPLQILCVAGYFRALYHVGGVVAQSVGWVYREAWRQAVYAGLVIAGAMIGSRYGLPGVAAGVSVAILYMFIALGQLALRATATPWPFYLRIQLSAVITALVTSAVALAVRLLLEAHQTSSIVITLAIPTVAAIPWSIGVLWTLGEPDLEPLRARLPGWCARLVGKVRRSGRSNARPNETPLH